MVESPRFKKNQGRDYVFYDSHPGFTAGKAAKQYWMFMCHVSPSATLSRELAMLLALKQVNGRGSHKRGKGCESDVC